MQNLRIYDFVDTVDFEKITFLIRKCLQHLTSDEQCAKKRHIGSSDFSLKVCLLHMNKKLHTDRWRKSERSHFRENKRRFEVRHSLAVVLYSVRCKISFIAIFGWDMLCTLQAIECLFRPHCWQLFMTGLFFREVKFENSDHLEAEYLKNWTTSVENFILLINRVDLSSIISYNFVWAWISGKTVFFWSQINIHIWTVNLEFKAILSFSCDSICLEQRRKGMTQLLNTIDVEITMH